MHLFFDTETTGLPKNWRAPITDSDNWPRLVQLAWIATDDGGKILSGQNQIIKPEGFTIPEPAAKVHGITTEKAIKEGINLKDALSEFANSLFASEILIAHNINYDINIIGAEFFRKQIKNNLAEIEKFCTMQTATNFCQIPHANGYGYKWPKLTELHTKLFDQGFDNAHDALSDVKACAKCFFEMKGRGII